MNSIVICLKTVLDLGFFGAGCFVAYVVADGGSCIGLPVFDVMPMYYRVALFAFATGVSASIASGSLLPMVPQNRPELEVFLKYANIVSAGIAALAAVAFIVIKIVMLYL